MATLRSDQNDHMERLAQEAVELVTHTAQKHGLDAEISWRDSFAATVNHGEAVKIVEEAARASALKIWKTDAPFRWSEDFGQFLARYCGALFCIGAGEDHAPLHKPDYDFPDELIETGICIFDKIVRQGLS